MRVSSELGLGKYHDWPPILDFDSRKLALHSALDAAVSQITVDDAVGDQLLDMADALVARTFEVFERRF